METETVKHTPTFSATPLQDREVLIRIEGNMNPCEAAAYIVTAANAYEGHIRLLEDAVGVLRELNDPSAKEVLEDIREALRGAGR